jgi:hypothetical protein
MTKNWYNVDVTVRFPEEKGHTVLRGSAYAGSGSEACRISIRQVLASRQVETLVCAVVSP